MSANKTSDVYRSVPETLARLGVGRTLLYELLGSGQLQSVSIGRRRLIPDSSIAAYQARLEAEACSTHGAHAAARTSPSQ